MHAPAEELAADRPRWTGQPGFFEIWFLVLFAPGTGRAWWLRWTTFAPRAGAARATLWAAAFDAAGPDPVVAAKRVLPATAWDGGPADRFAIRVGDASLAADHARGAVRAGGHGIAWDVRLTGGGPPVRRAPWLLERLPVPTHATHAGPDLHARGWVEVDGRRHALADVPAIRKHLWGARRVEELLWVACPRFDDAPATALEATAVRARRTGPALTPVWARAAGVGDDWTGLPWCLTNRIRRVGPTAVVVEALGATRGLRAHAACDPRTLAGWIYRDPGGWDVHVAQSDVARCALERLERPHPLAAWRVVERARSASATALEFHAPEPIPGVRYVGWDDGAPS
jgi:hypothetical protein